MNPYGFVARRPTTFSQANNRRYVAQVMADLDAQRGQLDVFRVVKRAAKICAARRERPAKR